MDKRTARSLVFTNITKGSSVWNKFCFIKKGRDDCQPSSHYSAFPAIPFLPKFAHLHLKPSLEAFQGGQQMEGEISEHFDPLPE